MSGRSSSNAKPNVVARLRNRVLLVLASLNALIQLVPYGRSHHNPPTRVEPAWDTPRTRALAERACFDCHSNETEWPWYSWIAPISWLIEKDVDEGREYVNFSTWNRVQKPAAKAAATVRDGEMPKWYYLPLHPEARLTREERAALVEGLERTIGPGVSP